jgi:hypothetical protein
VLVHGGFYPAFSAKHPDGLGDLPARGWHTGGGKKLERARRFLRVRTVSPSGEFVKLGEETAESAPWASVYDGRYGFAFYGHDPLGAVRRSPHALGIDTSCVFGGALTAAVLNDGRPPSAPELVSVPAARAYADRRFPTRE